MKGLNLWKRLLGKLASFALSAMAGASLLFVTWLTHPSFGRTNEGEIRFRKESSHSKPQVRACLLTGKGAEVFGGLRHMHVRLGSLMPSEVYVDERGTKVTLSISGNHTRVSLRSDVPLSVEELDVLDWCVQNPDLTWIPRELR